MNLNVQKSGKWQPFLNPLAKWLSEKREERESFFEFAKRNGLEDLITKNGLDPRTEFILKSEVVQEQIDISRTWGKEVVIGAGFVVAGEYGFFNPVEDGEGHIKVDWMVM